MKKVYLLLASSLFACTIHAASFDCQKATTVSERAICSDPNLSNADSELAKVYREAVVLSSDNGEGIKMSQKNWLKETRDCGNDQGNVVSCLRKLYEERIKNLKTFVVENKGTIGAVLNNVRTMEGGTFGGVITDVAPNGPAARALMQANDVITSINGMAFNSANEVTRLAQLRAGATYKLGIRRGSATLTVDVTPVSQAGVEAKVTSNVSMPISQPTPLQNTSVQAAPDQAPPSQSAPIQTENARPSGQSAATENSPSSQQPKTEAIENQSDSPSLFSRIGAFIYSVYSSLTYLIAVLVGIAVTLLIGIYPWGVKPARLINSAKSAIEPK